MELHVRILTGNNSNALVQQDLVALLAKMLVSMNLSKIFEQLGGGGGGGGGGDLFYVRQEHVESPGYYLVWREKRCLYITYFL